MATDFRIWPSCCFRRVLMGALLLLAQAPAAVADPLTVADAIETARILRSNVTFGALSPDGEILNSGSTQIFVSPNRKRWAAILIRGDVERNGNWAEVLVGSRDSLDAAANSHVVARFFADSLGEDYAIDQRPLRWLSNSSVGLLWRDERSLLQIFSVDVDTGSVRQLSRHPTSIIGFANHEDTYVYLAVENAAPSDAADRDTRRGVAVATRSIRRALNGHPEDDFEASLNYRWHILNGETSESRPVGGMSTTLWGWNSWTSMSPDGRFAIVQSTPESVPQYWDRYVSRMWTRAIERARTDRNDPEGRQLVQLYLVDLHRGTSRPLWDAPANPGARIAWSPDGRSVAIGPTFVPVSGADEAGLTGQATAVIDVVENNFRNVPITVSSLLALASMTWRDATSIEVQDGEDLIEIRRRGNAWRQSSVRRAVAQSTQAIDVRVEENMNSPPVLIASERGSERHRVIYDPNPQLSNRFSLGRVEMVEWRDPDGTAWIGRLYYPVNWSADRRYPLVIQTGGYTSARGNQIYSLYGGEYNLGLGPGISVFAAQPLANRGIMVLDAERKDVEAMEGSPDDGQLHASAYEAAIDHLDRLGLIDAGRVGISGFSNTGYLVQFALTHSDFPYAAAITDDNYDGSYFQSMRESLDQFAIDNRAAPYGEGLGNWMERAPGFNADRIRTPLRLQVSSPPPSSILGAWEMFARLRDLNRPVELFLIPQIERGSHGIQNPAQVLASQEGAVDWFDFWLNNHEDDHPSKADQYLRWRGLRELHLRNLSTPRRPLLDWSATPIVDPTP